MLGQLLLIAASFITQGPEILPGAPNQDTGKSGWGPDPVTGKYVFIIQFSPSALSSFSEGTYGKDAVTAVPERLRPFIEEVIVRVGTAPLQRIEPTPEMRAALTRPSQPSLAMLDDRRSPVDIDRSLSVSGQSNLGHALPALPNSNPLAADNGLGSQRNTNEILPGTGSRDSGSAILPNPSSPPPYRATNLGMSPNESPSLSANTPVPNYNAPNNNIPNSGMTNNNMPNGGMANGGLNNGLTGQYPNSGSVGMSPSGYPVATNGNASQSMAQDQFRPGNSVPSNTAQLMNKMTGSTPPSVGSFNSPYQQGYLRTATNNSSTSPLAPNPLSPAYNPQTPGYGSSFPPNLPSNYDPNFHLASNPTGRASFGMGSGGSNQTGQGTGHTNVSDSGRLPPGQNDPNVATSSWLPFATLLLLVINIYQFFWMAHVRTRYKELVISKRNAQLNLAS